MEMVTAWREEVEGRVGVERIFGQKRVDELKGN